MATHSTMPIHDQSIHDQLGQFSTQADFWRKWLQGLTAPTPVAVNRTATSQTVAARTMAPRVAEVERETGWGHQTIHVSKPLADAITSLLKQQHLEIQVLLCGLWGLLLSRYSGESDIVFGTQIIENQSTEENIEENISPLRLTVAATMPVGEWLKTLQNRWITLRPYRRTPLKQIAEWSDLPVTSLFETVLYVSEPPVSAALTSDYPLTVLAELSSPATLQSLQVHYDQQQFDAATIERLLGHLQTLLEGMVANPDQQVADLPLLTTRERHQLLVEWNSTQVEFPQDQSIHQRFAEQVSRTPDAIALVMPVGDTGKTAGDAGIIELAYQELNQRANRLAATLQQLDIQPGTFVAINMERAIEMIVAMLGILKVGGVYVPLDPAYPAERVAWMLEDTQAPVILTQSHLVAQLPPHNAAVICLDAAWGTELQPALADSAYSDRSVRATDLAYINYTSGSTGRPKGVAVPHRAVMRLVCGTDYTRLDANQTILQLAPISFDAATFEIWGALLQGGCCVLYPGNGIPDPQLLKAVIQTHGVTTMWLTAALFNTIVAEVPEALQGVKELLTGGEALSVAHIRRAQQLLPELQLINGYGPTESTTFTCCHRIPAPLSPDLTSIPIGKPIGNTEVYILDAHLQPVPIGVIGELYIGGAGLAQGYINRPELTRERFISHPFSTDLMARLYKTGDQVRYLPDGTIQFMGRNDHQVKIRGYRIELGEIEVALERQASVRDAVVLLHDSPESHLVAYVTPQGEQHPQVSQLRADLQAQLPDYMVPAVILVLDKLPLTPTGKIDRQALPIPARRSNHNRVAASTATEIALADIWCGVLGLEQVGITDNFFDLGGTSLLGMRLMVQVQRQFNSELRAVKLYEYPTIQALAEALSQPSQPSQSQTAYQAVQSRAQRQKAAQQRPMRRA